VSLVVGERGGWLAAQNPAWAWLLRGATSRAAPPEVEQHEWALLGTTERVSQLRRVRRVDPDAGRELLLSGWSGETAQDRRSLLEALAENLGPHDEDLLEAALDDRAASVRELATRLLDGLPGSRRAARMADRLRPLLSESGLLRRHLDVRLPDDPDAAGRRDGLERPPPGRSARGWWLERIVAGAPFDVWGASADTVVPRLAQEDAVAGLRRAASVRRTPDWARALLDHGGLDPQLLTVLPPEEQEARVVDALGTMAPSSVPAVLDTLPAQWSPRLSGAVVSRLAALKPEEIGPTLQVLLPRLVRGLHPDAVPALERWRARAQLRPRQHDLLGSLIQSRTLRQTISEAFHP
jgi:hypothetical protein